MKLCNQAEKFPIMIGCKKLFHIALVGSLVLGKVSPTEAVLPKAAEVAAHRAAMVLRPSVHVMSSTSPFVRAPQQTPYGIASQHKRWNSTLKTPQGIYMDKREILSEGGEELKEWLDLLANAQFKTKKDAQDSKFPPVQRAYHLLESASLPENIKQEYEESMKRRFQISHYINHEKEKSQKEGREEGIREGIKEGEKAAKFDMARKLKSMKLTTEEIKSATGLTTEEIESLHDNTK